MSYTPFRLRNPLLLMALAAIFPTLSNAADARVDFSAGPVTAVNVRGEARSLGKGAEVGNGDTIRTGDGRAQLRFSDGAMVSLQPETEFRIDDYRYNGKSDGEEKGFFSLLKGGLRTITGLVGRAQRSNYKVTTSVATIGIRGTEYTAALDASASELVVNTGEGLVEVCNAAGCMRLASGESGIVSGGRAPSRTESRPRLPPAAPSSGNQPVFSQSEERGAQGNVLPVSTPLKSGSGYELAWVGVKDGSPHLEQESAASAVFDDSALLTKTTAGGYSLSASALKGGFSMDGVISWGAWASGKYESMAAGPLALKDLHYVVGTPTSASDLTALGGTTATYALAGYTTPTTTTGLTGGAPSAVFTANFSGGPGSLVLDLSVPVNGHVYCETLNGTFSGAATFTLSASSSAKGFFAGANASHAGMTYKMDTGYTANPVGDIMGGLVFKR